MTNKKTKTKLVTGVECTGILKCGVRVIEVKSPYDTNSVLSERNRT